MSSGGGGSTHVGCEELKPDRHDDSDVKDAPWVAEKGAVVTDEARGDGLGEELKCEQDSAAPLEERADRIALTICVLREEVEGAHDNDDEDEVVGARVAHHSDAQRAHGVAGGHAAARARPRAAGGPGEGVDSSRGHERAVDEVELVIALAQWPCWMVLAPRSLRLQQRLLVLERCRSERRGRSRCWLWRLQRVHIPLGTRAVLGLLRGARRGGGARGHGRRAQRGRRPR